MDAGIERLRLRREIESSLRRAFDPDDVLPRLARLARLAPASSDDGVFAHWQLAELLAERHPWRAAIFARRALAHRASDDRAWAVLAFCHTLLGNFRSAVAAYRSALACAPANPWYAHNLGHLFDVALGRPEQALPWLRAAYAARSDNSEIIASYVHALARAGHITTARPILARAIMRLPSCELEAIMRWLDQGAPSRPRAQGDRGDDRDGRDPRDLTELLMRGLVHLPFDPTQRQRALLLARDALVTPSVGCSSTNRACLASAVAYAIVYVDHVPLSQAEVAAPFRVAVAHLREHFAELRARLDLVRGDARYATPWR
jgi:tetratricopeptide (TPR) repeat protein